MNSLSFNLRAASCKTCFLLFLLKLIWWEKNPAHQEITRGEKKENKKNKEGKYNHEKRVQ